MNPNKAMTLNPLLSPALSNIDGFESLAGLALDLRSSWNHATDMIWKRIDPELWDLTRNPWVVLQAASHDRIERLLADPEFRVNVAELVEARRKSAEAPAWYQRANQQGAPSGVAYFSMEFMLAESLPIYACADQSGNSVIQEMRRGLEMAGSVGGFIFTTSVPATRAISDFTARIVPFRKDIQVPLEIGAILWQR